MELKCVQFLLRRCRFRRACDSLLKSNEHNTSHKTLDDDKRRDISKWRGKNLLGFALMEVREQIRAESGENSGNSSI